MKPNEKKLSRRQFAKRFLDHALNQFEDSAYMTLTIREIKDMIIREKDLATRKTAARLLNLKVC